MSNKQIYESKLYFIKEMIKRLSSAGLDVSELTGRLDKLNISNNNSNKAFKKDYTEYLTELNKIELELEKYELYFKINNNLNYIESYLKDTNNLNEFNFHLNLTIETLELSRKLRIELDKDYFEEGESLIKRTYRIAYEMMKLEMLVKNTQKIFSEVKEDEIYLFDSFIKEDISKLSDCPEDLESRMYEIRSNIGLKANYFDLSLIYILLKYLDNPVINRLKEHTNEVLKSIKDNWQDTSTISKELDEISQKMYPYSDNIKNRKKTINQKAISILITLGIIIGGAYGNYRLGKYFGKKHVYNKTTTSYSELTDEVTQKEEQVNAKFGFNDTTVITIYYPWEEVEKGPTRLVETYDLSNITLDDIYDYLAYDLSELSPSRRYVISSNYQSEKNKYQEEYREITIKTYEDTGQTVQKKGSIVLLEILYLIFILCLFLEISDDYVLILEPIIDILTELEKIDLEKSKLEKINEELKIKLKEEVCHFLIEEVTQVTIYLKMKEVA